MNEPAARLGPVMLSVDGLSLTAQDRDVLSHPMVGGVILFARNYESVKQVTALCNEIKALRDEPLLIAVDHEGGRVQRFKDGFTEIPPMRLVGDLWDANAPVARARAFEIGQIIAHELHAVGVDFSFTPVVDLDYGGSTVIGNRAFHRNAYAAASLACALAQGLRSVGMAAVGKHFPGHGYVRGDTHHETSMDERTFEQLHEADLIPFMELIAHDVDALMMAHVIYPQIDSKPAGYSEKWIQTILRQQLRFRGCVISDDLGMVAAGVAGDLVARAQSAVSAGADLILCCNDRPAALDLIARWQVPATWSDKRVQRMRFGALRNAL
jgi:beta-N-acetylhexosaminidase